MIAKMYMYARDITMGKIKIPSINEIKLNPSSRSAKLRYGIKLNNHSDFSEFTQKFNYLLEVEKLAKGI